MLQAFLVSLFLIMGEALLCWECINEKSNELCIKNGYARLCARNQRNCQNEIRYGSYGMLITKGCKQSLACKNNLKSLKFFLKTKNLRCNSNQTDAVCRCCCSRMNCNKNNLGCEDFLTMTNGGKPSRTSRRSTTSPLIKENTTTSVPPITTTEETGLVLTCQDPGVPRYGSRSCNSRLTNDKRYFLETICHYTCDGEFILEGFEESICLPILGTLEAQFNNPLPQCKRCQMLDSVVNGAFSCTNGLDATCQLTCNETYAPYPPNVNSTICQLDGSWSLPIPCCLQECPPNVFADIVFLLDLSSSVSEKDWFLMKSFVMFFISIFDVNAHATNFAIVRYNDAIDLDNLIRLGNFSEDKDGLLDTFDQFPYEAKGSSDTGLAVQYALDFILKTSSGDRRATNVFILITDSEASNDESFYVSSLSIRAEKIPAFVIGIERSPPEELNIGQLENFTGSKANLLLVEEFISLNDTLGYLLAEKLCSIRTCDWNELLEMSG